MRDALTEKQIKRVLSPTYLATGDTAFVGEIIDHQGFDAASYLIATGSLADSDATFTVLLEEGDDSSVTDAAAVADGDMVSQTSGTAPETAAAFAYNHDNQVRSLGYIGAKRYTRLTITPANNTGNIYLSAVCVLEKGATAPIAHATA